MDPSACPSPDNPAARTALTAPTGGCASTRLILNLVATALDGEPLAKVGTVERPGPITLAKLMPWLSRSDVTVTPVIREGERTQTTLATRPKTSRR